MAEPLLKMTVSRESSPKSMNQLIREHHVSQALRRRLRREGSFIVNGKQAPWDTILQSGDVVEVFFKKEEHLLPVEMDLEIIFEDEYMLVINKPSGLLMHPTSSVRNDTLANGVIAYYQSTGQETASFHPVHRLDKDTRGLVIIAKNAMVQHAFSKMPPIRKVYDALVDGELKVKCLAIHWPIGRKEGSIIEREVTTSGQAAHTDVMVVSHNPRLSHVRCFLHTGRTHQIRVHLSHLGYPLVGDDLYGGSLDIFTKQALQASELFFIHPITREPIHLGVPLPLEWENII